MFLADEMLGKLARELRILGYDVAYEKHEEDDALLEKARHESRLLLTRDRQLANHADEQGVLVRSRDPEEQLERLVDRLGLEPSAEAFLSRCLECNTRLEPAEDADVPASVEDRDHYRCPACGQVYWAGTHAEDMVERLSGYVGEAGRETLLDPCAGDKPSG